MKHNRSEFTLERAFRRASRAKQTASLNSEHLFKTASGEIAGFTIRRERRGGAGFENMLGFGEFVWTNGSFVNMEIM